jgi:hypothetical protein
VLGRAAPVPGLMSRKFCKSPVDGRVATPVPGRAPVAGRVPAIGVDVRGGVTLGRDTLGVDGRLTDGDGRLTDGDGRLTDGDGRLTEGERLTEGLGRL